MALSENQPENESNPGEGDNTEQEETILDKVQHNPALLDFVSRKALEMIDLEKQAKTLNEKKKLIREEVVEKGFNRHGFSAAIARKRLTETDREERELSYQLCCKALGVEHGQLDLKLDLASVKPV